MPTWIRKAALALAGSAMFAIPGFAAAQQTVKIGVTVLMVEQNAYAALELCDRSYLLESGKVTLRGTGEELLTDDHVKRAYLGG